MDTFCFRVETIQISNHYTRLLFTQLSHLFRQYKEWWIFPLFLSFLTKVTWAVPWGFPCSLAGKESTRKCRRSWFNSWVRKICWRRDRLLPIFLVFPGGSAGKESACNGGKPGFDPWVGKIPWKKEWLPIPLFWPGEFWPGAIPYFTQKNNLEGTRLSDKQIQINLKINGVVIQWQYLIS